jgi:hypothetical protein
VKRPRASAGDQNKLLAKMEGLATLLRDAERLLKRYEKEMDELVQAMKGESQRPWAKALPKGSATEDIPKIAPRCPGKNRQACRRPTYRGSRKPSLAIPRYLAG